MEKQMYGDLQDVTYGNPHEVPGEFYPDGWTLEAINRVLREVRSGE